MASVSLSLLTLFLICVSLRALVACCVLFFSCVHEVLVFGVVVALATAQVACGDTC